MSSKTIEIASIHRGPVRLSTRRDENRVIKFEETNEPGIFITKVDEDEAEILLEIGRPGYWKPGVDADAVSNVNTTDAEPGTDAVPGADSGKDDDADSAGNDDTAAIDSTGAVADSTNTDTGATEEPTSGNDTETTGDKTADNEVKPVLPCSFKHKGAGKFEVIDATGVVIVGGLTKDAAEAKTVELNTPE